MTTDNLEVLAPTGASVTFRGEMLQVLPLTIGALPRLVRESRPVIEALLDKDHEKVTDADFVGLLTDLVGEHGEAVIHAIALCVDKPYEVIAKGDLAETFELGKAIYEVNRDFFVQRLAPLLANLRGAASESSGDGQTASNS